MWGAAFQSQSPPPKEHALQSCSAPLRVNHAKQAEFTAPVSCLLNTDDRAPHRMPEGTEWQASKQASKQASHAPMYHPQLRADWSVLHTKLPSCMCALQRGAAAIGTAFEYASSGHMNVKMT